MKMNEEDKMIQAQLKAAMIAGKLDILQSLYNDIYNEIASSTHHFESINSDLVVDVLTRMKYHEYFAAKEILKQFNLGEI